MSETAVAADAQTALKESVAEFWREEPCNSRHGASTDRLQYFRDIHDVRFTMEPNILELARFEESAGKKVLEIGVGVGSDFLQWVKNGAVATGADLTERSIDLTREYLTLSGYAPGIYTLRT